LTGWEPWDSKPKDRVEAAQSFIAPTRRPRFFVGWEPWDSKPKDRVEAAQKFYSTNPSAPLFGYIPSTSLTQYSGHMVYTSWYTPSWKGGEYAMEGGKCYGWTNIIYSMPFLWGPQLILVILWAFLMKKVTDLRHAMICLALQFLIKLWIKV